MIGTGQRPFVLVGCFVLIAAMCWVAPKVGASQTGSIALPIFILVSFGLGIACSNTHTRSQLRRLSRRIGRFVETGERQAAVTQSNMPPDLISLHNAFDDLSRMSVADEKRAQQSREDRAVLIGEVHHRVKNNLQLTSSILSLHIHDAQTDAASKIVLRRVQERINSLGTVHTDIYKGGLSGSLPVSTLLGEIADSAEKLGESLGHPIQIRRDLSDTNLPPDQVVPLSLYVAEAMRSILRVGQPTDMSVSFRSDASYIVAVCVLGDHPGLNADAIALKFLRVLASQLGGEMSEKRMSGSYALTLIFPPLQVSKPVA